MWLGSSLSLPLPLLFSLPLPFLDLGCLKYNTMLHLLFLSFRPASSNTSLHCFFNVPDGINPPHILSFMPVQTGCILSLRIYRKRAKLAERILECSSYGFYLALLWKSQIGGGGAVEQPPQSFEHLCTKRRSLCVLHFCGCLEEQNHGTECTIQLSVFT